jgi:hypothetical protein
MSRPRSPDSHNSLSDTPGTIQPRPVSSPGDLTVEGTLLRSRSSHAEVGGQCEYHRYQTWRAEETKTLTPDPMHITYRCKAGYREPFLCEAPRDRRGA